MNEEVRVLRAATLCAEVLARQGIKHRAATLVLFGMVEGGLTYWESLACFADWERQHDGVRFPVERWHSEVCYLMIKAWIVEPPAQWFEVMAAEVRQLADGIPA